MAVRKRDFAVSSESTARSENTYKPLPLKQRTSSSSDRRDFTPNTWISLLQLIKFREYFIPVNHFSIWRRHNAWAFEDGKDLTAYIGNRYASNMVFMSLLLSTECGVLFNSSTIASQVRDDLVEAHWGTVSFWAGLFMIISSLLTILSLISTFTFTAMISAIDERNAHCILRSSIGQYATELPGRLIVCSIYTFLISFMSFFFILLPLGTFSICLLLGTVFFFVHVVSVFSSFGRIIMHTGAMGKGRIFSSEYEELLVPHSLHNNLLAKAKCNLAHNTSIIRQYRHKQRQIDRFLLEEELYDHLSGTSMIDRSLRMYNGNTANPNDFGRLRSDSKVRFADEEALVNNDKEVIGGDIEGMFGSARPMNGSSIRHFRSLTPLSDMSDGSHQQMGQINSTRSTIDGELSSLAAPPRKFFSNSERPRETSDISAVSSLHNVSNSSLEQWLQGSPSETGAKDGKESSAKSININEVKYEKKEIEPIGLPPVVPPHAVSVTTTTWSNNSINRTNKMNETHTSREKGDSATIPFPDSESLSSQRINEREMLEDERFIFDYGDFEDDGADGEKKKHPIYGTNHKLHNYDRVNKSESNSSNDSTKNERTKLLK
jgi:hypothetical protein